MKGLPLDHVAVAVTSLEEAGRLYERITGKSCSPVETLPAQGVRVAFVGSVELLEPLADDTAVGRYLERNGPGLHHIAFGTSDIRREMARLRDEGFTLVDQEPRPGARGHEVAFLHPRGTGKVLVELVSRRGHPST